MAALRRRSPRGSCKQCEPGAPFAVPLRIIRAEWQRTRSRMPAWWQSMWSEVDSLLRSQADLIVGRYN